MSVEQQTYALDSKLSCPKHPAKHIEFFCKHPQCQQKLFCSNCILKKQACSHDQEIVDIGQYLFEHKQFYESKGLSADPQLNQFYQKLPSSRKQYEFMIQNQFTKFSDEVDKLVEQMTKIINNMRYNIKSQLNSYVQIHNKSEVDLEKRLSQSFSFTFHSKYNTYDQIFRKNQHKSLEGLKQLLTKLNTPVDESYYKSTKQILNNLISLQVQSPQIDYSQYQNIKINLKVFQKKVSQTGGTIINLKSPLKSSRTKWLSSFSVKKMEISNNFSSYHTAPVSVMGAIENNLFIGSQNGEIRVFDSESFQCLTAFRAHDSAINAVISQNRNLITASDDKTIKIWNFSQPIKLKQMNYTPDLTLTGHTQQILSIKLVSEHLIVSGSADLTLRLWDLKDNSSKSYSGHLNNVLCVTSNSQGTTVISGSADKTIKIWRVQKKPLLICEKTLSGHHDSVTYLVLTQDDNTLFSSSYDKFIRVWNIYTGDCTKVLPSQHLGQLTKFDLFTNNLLLSSSNDGGLRFWDSESYNCVHNIDVRTQINTFVIIDKKVFIAGEDKSIYVCQ